MQCKCGGETKTPVLVITKLKAELKYYECKDCHRVSSARLFIEDVLVAEDPLARQHFNALDPVLAAELLSTATAPQPERFTTGSLF